MKRNVSTLGPAAVRPVPWWRPVLVGAVFWLILLACTDPFRHGGNVWSRYMTIESLVERGTQSVGKSPLLRISGSPDLVRFHGRYYSDKPPVLPAIGAVVYAPLFHVGGIRMAESAAAVSLVNRVLVAAIIGLASALAVGAFRSLLSLVDVRPWAADLIALAIGMGSLLFSYGVTFNNHSVAAGLIAVAVAGHVVRGRKESGRGGPPGGSSAARGGTPAALGGHALGRCESAELEDAAARPPRAAGVPPAGPDRSPRRRGRAALVGFAAAFAATIDLPAGALWWATLGAWLAWEDRRAILPFAIGSFAPIALHTALQWPITGSPLPVEFYPEGFEYPGSYWSTEAGTFREQGSRSWFLLELLVGPQGWLTVTPLLLLAPVGWALGWRSGGRPRVFAAATIGTTAILLAYYAFGVRRTDFSGLSYGTRHLLAITPVVGFWSVYGAFGSRRRRWLVPGLVVLWMVGLVYAYQGMRDPWSRIERRGEPSIRILQKLVPYPHSSYRR